MIRIVCRKSPLVGASVRLLLKKVGFRATSFEHFAALAFLYPYNNMYRRSFSQLSLMERVADVQVLGFASMWRVTRRFTCLALGIVPLLKNKKIYVYHAEHLSSPSRLFFSLLSNYVAHETIHLVYGHKGSASSCPCDEELHLEEGERKVTALLAKLESKQPLEPREYDKLSEYGSLCLLSNNKWQAHIIYKGFLAQDDSPDIHHRLAFIYNFFGQTERAEWHYRRVFEHEDPITRVYACYAVALLYLRYHPTSLRSPARAHECLDKAYTILDDYNGPREKYLYARLVVNAAYSLLLFRKRKFHLALETIDNGLETLATLPQSEKKEFCYVHALSNRAQLMRALGRLEESAQINKEMIKRDPKNPWWPEELAKCLIDLYRYDEAIHVLQTALTFNFYHAPFYALMGKCYRIQKNHLRAFSLYTKALRYDPNNATYKEQLAALDQKYGAACIQNRYGQHIR